MTDGLRGGIDRLIDQVEMSNFNKGFEACLDAIDEISNQQHNEGRPATADTLRWAVRELKGENIETHDFI